MAVVLALLHFNLVLLAVIGGLWNAEHTLMQRYGLTRIYGRKGGDDHGRLERAPLDRALVPALAWTAADVDTPARLRQLSLVATTAAASRCSPASPMWRVARRAR